LLIDLAGVEDVGSPRTTIEIGRQSVCLFAGRHSAGQQNIDERLTEGRAHAAI
jgi:hypothetical protein